MGFLSSLGRIAGGVVDGLFGTNLVGDYDAKKNYDLQKSQLQYQKDLQQTIFNREDTAVQRRAADLKAAGMNPLMAAGAAAQSGAVVKTETPQRDTAKYDVLNSILGKAALGKTMAEIRLLQAERDNVLEQNKVLRSNAAVKQVDKIKAEQDKNIIDSWFGRNIVAPIRVMFQDTGTNVGSVSNYVPKKKR